MQTNQKRQTNRRWSVAIFALAIFLGSCQRQQLPDQNDPITKSLGKNASARLLEETPYREGTNTVLGENKRNPYTVEVMSQAWQNLAEQGYFPKGKAAVTTTHYYVKFKPINSDQYEELHKDSTLSFSDMPIESTVLENGDYYHDPGLPDDVPTYQYTAVKIGYEFPREIEYEILEKLYIPEDDENFNYENGGIDDLFVDRLLNEAYRLTGNEEDIMSLDNYGERLASARYRPGGRIRVFDTRLQQWIGMEGVRVQARRWFTYYFAYPDYNGNYRMSQSYKRPCNYSIWFATPFFSVRHNLVNTTFWINGPKISGDWNYDLNNSYQRFAGHVFRGAFRYNFKNIGGLQRPWIPFKRQIYVAKDGYKDWSGINWIILPVIKIARYENEKGGEYESDEIFSTTSHETGHTSHVLRMNAGVIQYWQVSSQLQESWPCAIEWYLTHIEYAERGIANYGDWNYHPANPPQYPNDQAYQYWTINLSKDYTSLYINLVDRVNDQSMWTFSGIPNDEVMGYTLPMIEQKILKHSYGLSSLSTQLKNNKPAGVTDAQIDLLLSSY